MRYHVSCSTGPCLPTKVGSGAATCTVAPDPASLIVRASAPSRVSWLRTCGEDSGALRVLRLRILPPYQEGSGAVTCHTVSCGPHASNIKKSLACLPVQLNTHVFNTRTHIFKTSDIRAIMGLQDVWTCCTIKACKTCSYSSALTLLTTRKAPLQCQATRQYNIMHQTECDLAGL
jgi:hypothetical protein